MIEQLFRNESKKLKAIEPIDYGMGAMTLDLPQMSERNIISQINDANQIAYFGTFESPIRLIVSEGKAELDETRALENIIFKEGYAYSSHLKSERDEGIYYLKLKDQLKKDWVFKLQNDSILSCNVALDLNFQPNHVGA